MGIEIFIVCSFLLVLVLIFNVVLGFVDGFLTLISFKDLDIKIKIDSLLKKF